MIITPLIPPDFNADLPFSEEPPEDAQSEQLVADVLQPSDDDGASR